MSTNMTLQSKVGVFAGAALLRLVLSTAFPSLPDLLTGRVEISTPVTSFKRCKAHRNSPSREAALSPVH
jgi:phosphatidylinositol glycan class U